MDILLTDHKITFVEVNQISGGDLRTDYQEGFVVIPEHPEYPAMFTVTLTINWIIPYKFQITVVGVVMFSFRNNNMPTDIETLKNLAKQAFTILDKQVNEDKIQHSISDDLYVPPIDFKRTLTSIQGALSNAYSVN